MTQLAESVVGQQPMLPELRVNEHITLQEFTPDDAQVTYDLIMANKDYLSKTEPRMVPPSVEALRGYLEARQQDVAEGNHAAYKIMHDGEFVGGVNLVDRVGDTMELGYWLIESAQGKGIVTASAKELISFGFTHMGVREVILDMNKTNTRSQATAQRIGGVLLGESPVEPDDVRWVIQKHD